MIDNLLRRQAENRVDARTQIRMLRQQLIDKFLATATDQEHLTRWVFQHRRHDFAQQRHKMNPEGSEMPQKYRMRWTDISRANRANGAAARARRHVRRQWQ